MRAQALSLQGPHPQTLLIRHYPFKAASARLRLQGRLGILTSEAGFLGGVAWGQASPHTGSIAASQGPTDPLCLQVLALLADGLSKCSWGRR